MGENDGGGDAEAEADGEAADATDAVPATTDDAIVDASAEMDCDLDEEAGRRRDDGEVKASSEAAAPAAVSTFAV